MKKFEIFNNDKLGKVRIVTINNEPWFVLRDVCAIVGLNNVTSVKQRLQGDGVDSTDLIDSMGRKQNATIINESNLYLCILRSDKEEAKEFADWITKEVIPSIRKTGKYDINKPKQLTLPAVKEHKIIKKYYNKTPVMSMLDLLSLNFQTLVQNSNLATRFI